MAFKPSDKRKTKDEDITPNILPIMNLMVVLIPVLLSLSQKVQLSLLEYLPPPVEVVSEDSEDNSSNDDGGGGDEPARIDLLLNVSDAGFEVSLFGDTKGDNFKKIERKPILGPNGQPLINPQTNLPLVEYDFVSLHNELVRIRKDIIGKPLRTEDFTDPVTGAVSRREIFKYEDAQKMNIAAKGRTPWKVMVQILDAAREFDDSTGVLSDGTVIMGKKPLFPQPGFGQLQ